MNRTACFLLPLCWLIMVSGTSAQYLLDGPETVLYDSVSNRYLVSNIHNGNIVQIDEFGSYTLFSNALSSTYGMAISGNTLFVSSASGPLAGIVGFDLTTAAVVYHRATITYGENGMTVDTSGNVYIADTGGSRILKLNTASGLVTIAGNISIPNAVLFDAVNNRLLATSNVWWTPVYEIAILSGALTAVTTTTGQFSGLTQDQQGNFYVAFFGHNKIYKFDNSLTGTPETLTGFSGPEGILFHQNRSTLVVPNLMSDRVSFTPMNIDLWMDVDSTFGWAPLTVTFQGSSAFEIESWHWDFGDGHTDDTQSPSHTYTEPGSHTVTLTAITTDQDTLFREYPHHMSVLADSLWVEDTQVDPENKLVITVSGRNSVPLDLPVICVKYSGTCNLVLDSINLNGCRTEFFAGIDTIDQDDTNREISLRLRPRYYGSPLYLNPGSGPLLKIYAHADNPDLDGVSAVDVGGYSPTYTSSFTGVRPTYQPIAVTGTVTMPPCCGTYTGGFAGNANCSEDGKRTLADITKLIDRVYISKNSLCCEANGNANGSEDGKITLADITRLIDHIYISKLETANCM